MEDATRGRRNLYKEEFINIIWAVEFWGKGEKRFYSV
jgi:hypothetical protein